MTAPWRSTETAIEVPARLLARGAVIVSNICYALCPYSSEGGARKGWRLRRPLCHCQRSAWRLVLATVHSAPTRIDAASEAAGPVATDVVSSESGCKTRIVPQYGTPPPGLPAVLVAKRPLRPLLSRGATR